MELNSSFITASIQEVMLLAMLRTIAREGVSAEPVLPVVRELSASSGRHISKVNILLLSSNCLDFSYIDRDVPNFSIWHQTCRVCESLLRRFHRPRFVASYRTRALLIDWISFPISLAPSRRIRTLERRNSLQQAGPFALPPPAPAHGRR